MSFLQSCPESIGRYQCFSVIASACFTRKAFGFQNVLHGTCIWSLTSQLSVGQYIPPKYYTLVPKHVLFILHVFKENVSICMYISKEILRALAHLTNRQVANSGNKSDLCRSQITLFNETLTSEWKHPKFAGLMSERQATSAKPQRKDLQRALGARHLRRCSCISPNGILAWRALCPSLPGIHHLRGMTGWSLGYMRDKSWVLWFSPHVYKAPPPPIL